MVSCCHTKFGVWVKLGSFAVPFIPQLNTKTGAVVVTVPSFLYISKHVDISAGALRMTASLFSTRENVHWEIYYYTQ